MYLGESIFILRIFRFRVAFITLHHPRSYCTPATDSSAVGANTLSSSSAISISQCDTTTNMDLVGEVVVERSRVMGDGLMLMDDT